MTIESGQSKHVCSHMGAKAGQMYIKSAKSPFKSTQTNMFKFALRSHPKFKVNDLRVGFQT